MANSRDATYYYNLAYQLLSEKQTWGRDPRLFDPIKDFICAAATVAWQLKHPNAGFLINEIKNQILGIPKLDGKKLLKKDYLTDLSKRIEGSVPNESIYIIEARENLMAGISGEIKKIDNAKKIGDDIRQGIFGKNKSDPLLNVQEQSVQERERKTNKPN